MWIVLMPPRVKVRVRVGVRVRVRVRAMGKGESGAEPPQRANRTPPRDRVGVS